MLLAVTTPTCICTKFAIKEPFINSNLEVSSQRPVFATSVEGDSRSRLPAPRYVSAPQAFVSVHNTMLIVLSDTQKGDLAFLAEVESESSSTFQPTRFFALPPHSFL
jgi:hypothetical protein